MGQRRTEPLLAEDDGLPVYSDGYRLIRVVHDHTSLRLYRWQQDLLIRILERCPPGHPREGQLRYRQVVVSMARQNGKSVIAAVLAIYGMTMHSPTPRVLGVARNAVQAGIVYDYASDLINASEALSGLLETRGTASLGISRTDGAGKYVVRASNSEALNGYPSTLSIVDEIHVLKPGVYNAIVKSQTAQTNPLIVGITTAGDVTSTTLKRLYERGEGALAGTDETFGFFVWEADSDEFTLDNITAANPRVIEGVKDAQEIYDDDKHELPADIRRFTLNRFIDGLAEPWIDPARWTACAGTGLEDFKDCVYVFETADKNAFVTIYAAKKVDGVIKTALVARLINPNLETLKAWTARLRKAGRCAFAMNPNRLRALTEYLDGKRLNPIRIFGDRQTEAAAVVHALVLNRAVQHDNQSMVNGQHARATLKYGRLSGKEIDLANASLYAIYAAETKIEKGAQIA